VGTEQATGKARYRLSVFAGGRAVYQRVETLVSNVPQAPQAHYLHRDHLGSVDRLSPAISGGSGVTAYSFDAFGGRRGTNWQADGSTYGQNHWTERGYTGHEHLDDVELIHMNGRVQHPGLGRFLSPDPVLGDLGSPQTLNPYSYVANNPLAFTDPSGFTMCPDGSPFDCTTVTGRLTEGSPNSLGGGISYQAPPPAGDVGGGFTVQEAPSRGDPGQVQQAGRDGSGLTSSEQRELSRLLAVMRGNSGGFIFFGKGKGTTNAPGAGPGGRRTEGGRPAQSRYSIDKAVAHLVDCAGDKSTGLCATRVREAIEAGGVVLERTRYAKDYGASLEKGGFGAVKVGPD
jgi:RHS repeat-associated protein